jgi:chondroitin AC lyase
LAAEWIQHDGLRYEFPAGGALLAGIATQTGEWKSVSAAVASPAGPQSLPVFSLVIDHGMNPSSAAYAYAVRPVDAPATQYHIVANTPDQQAVAWDERRISIVFWRPGTVQWASGRSIAASAPCLVDLDGDHLSVSDPTWTLSTVELKLDGRAIPASLRTDAGYAGSTTTVEVR